MSKALIVEHEAEYEILSELENDLCDIKSGKLLWEDAADANKKIEVLFFNRSVAKLGERGNTEIGDESFEDSFSEGLWDRLKGTTIQRSRTKCSFKGTRGLPLCITRGNL